MAKSHSEFAELFAAHQHQVFGFILGLVRNNADAQDILQQSAITMWNKFDTFTPGTEFVRWAITIARYETLNYLKYRRRSRLCFDQDLIELLAAEFRERSLEMAESRRTALKDCLPKLSSEDGKLIESRYSHGLGSRQLSELLGRSQASICNSLRRIRESLLTCIERRLAQENNR
ncbi:RNA polymerase sigma factor CarQ [Planctomycetes bacterium MalM25]|nr:RNA polymerase sigma factor CarQ [Planctomycetes bacterium MalM25]